jgi:hypothetical protein
MRKILVTTAVLAGLGGILAVAQASQDTTPKPKPKPEPGLRSQDGDRKEADRIATQRDDRARDSRGEEHEHGHGKDKDGDSD